MARFTKCKFCGRPITFMVTPNGGNIACETKAVYYRACRGGPDLLVTGDGEVVAGEILPQAAQGALVGMVLHRVHCTGPKRAKNAGGCPTKTVAAAKAEKKTLPKAEQLEFGEWGRGETGRNR